MKWYGVVVMMAMTILMVMKVLNGVMKWRKQLCININENINGSKVLN
jgi:hypothetical protein